MLRGFRLVQAGLSGKRHGDRLSLKDQSGLVMDEPFGALDLITRDRMANELLQIWSSTPGTTVMVGSRARTSPLSGGMPRDPSGTPQSLSNW